MTYDQAKTPFDFLLCDLDFLTKFGQSLYPEESDEWKARARLLRHALQRFGEKAAADALKAELYERSNPLRPKRD